MATFLVELQFVRTGNRFDRVRAAHRAYWERMATRGVLLGGGIFVDEAGGILLCEAGCRSDLREVVLADPFIDAGVIARYEIREWTAVLGTSSSQPNLDPVGLGLTMADGSGPLVPRIEGSPPLVRAKVLGHFNELTPHEQRIADLMVSGKTNREIAVLFSVSARAVELHITSMYRKLGISRRAQLAGALGEAA